MCTPHFEIQNGVLTKCRMSGEENVTVTIPDGVTSIGDSAFYHCDNLTICAPAGSYAIEYARDNGIRFKEI